MGHRDQSNAIILLSYLSGCNSIMAYSFFFFLVVDKYVKIYLVMKYRVQCKALQLQDGYSDYLGVH